MPDRSFYFAAGVIARRSRRGDEFLVQKSEYRDGHIETKFIGGMEELSDNGNPFKTYRDELEEEAYLRIRDRVVPELLVRVPKRDSPEKFFFFLWRGNCKGRLRTEEIWDDDTTLLHPPEWVDLKTLKARLFRTHQAVIPELERRGFR